MTHSSPTVQETCTQEPLVLPAKPGAPIACDLSGARDTAEERLAEYARLFAHALTGRARDGEAVVFTFVNKAGVADWVVDLAQREHACCPFFTYQVTFSAAHVVWRTSTTAGPAAEAMLDEFHALPELTGDGLSGLFQRLADRGVSIIPTGNKGFAIEPRQQNPGLLAKLKGCGC